MLAVALVASVNLAPRNRLWPLCIPHIMSTALAIGVRAGIIVGRFNSVRSLSPKSTGGLRARRGRPVQWADAAPRVGDILREALDTERLETESPTSTVDAILRFP